MCTIAGTGFTGFVVHEFMPTRDPLVQRRSRWGGSGRLRRRSLSGGSGPIQGRERHDGGEPVELQWPSMSRNTATLPYGSTRGADTNDDPAFRATIGRQGRHALDQIEAQDIHEEVDRRLVRFDN